MAELNATPLAEVGHDEEYLAVGRARTKVILETPNVALDAIFDTAGYCSTAEMILHHAGGLGAGNPSLKAFLMMPDILEIFIRKAPVMIERLEALARECPVAGAAGRYAQNYLPKVREFYELLQQYAKETRIVKLTFSAQAQQSPQYGASAGKGQTSQRS